LRLKLYRNAGVTKGPDNSKWCGRFPEHAEVSGMSILVQKIQCDRRSYSRREKRCIRT